VTPPCHPRDDSSTISKDHTQGDRNANKLII
jgi:hypothetical protein